MESSALDRLIEEGLTLYGQGDLDGALLLWEQVLADDPDNAQATSYVDYVRLNYDLLTTDTAEEASAPFGIADDGEPEYLIEISPGEALAAPEYTAEVKAKAGHAYMDALDEGWTIDDEDASEAIEPTVQTFALVSPDSGDDDEPMALAGDRPATTSSEDDTREFPVHGVRRDPAAEASAEFGHEGTPAFGSPQDVQSFGAQPTGVRKRDLGFVKAALAGRSQELDMTLGSDHSDDTKETTAAPAVSYPAEPTVSTAPPTAFELGFVSGEIELPNRAAQPKPPEVAPTLPRPATRDLPDRLVPPQARSIESFELDPPIEPPPPPGGAPTRDLGSEFQNLFAPPPDTSDKPTLEFGRDTQSDADPLVSAPTLELGLRALSGAPTRELTEASTNEGTSEGANEGTSADIVLPFDPIDARTAQILDAVDQGAAKDEAPEERTRRRITRLLEAAGEWATTNEFDRAVAAVDLALSEDPGSALAQKLIHRNRDTIMQVFQTFLGNLDRQPELARPLHELSTAPISPRAAFLLSRVDGSLTLDEILDVSGMPRLEAYRYLCQLFLRGILR